MSCFWDAIVQMLTNSDYAFAGCDRPKTKYELIYLLQKNTRRMVNVSWQNEILTERFVDEMIEYIKSYDVNNINNGHLTSGCEGFLLLISELFYLNIDHYYMKHLIKYRHSMARRRVVFSSTSSHFKLI